MAESRSWPEPNRLTKIMGVLFTVLYGLSLAYLVLFWATGQPGPVTPRAVIIGLAVGIAYLAGRAHPMIRIVPSVLWIAVVGIPSVVSPWRSGSTRGGVVEVLCAVVLICALACHAYVDARVILARSRAEAGEPVE